MLFLKEDFALGIVKEIGDQDAILIVNGNEVKVELSEETKTAEELHQYVLQQDNMLVPINLKTNELFLTESESWNEEMMDELVEASRVKGE
jgi:hypothetical protein